MANNRIEKQEVPSNQSGWFIRELFNREDIYKGEPGKPVNIQFDQANQDYNLDTFILTDTGSQGSKDWTHIQASHVLRRITRDREFPESVSLNLVLPDEFQNSKFESLFDYALKKWDLQNKGVLGKVFPKASRENQPQVYASLYQLNREDKSESVVLAIEQLISGSGFGSYGVKTGREYTEGICNWIQKYWPEMLDYFRNFQKNELPQLLRTREKRVRDKPPAVTAEILKNKYHANITQSYWEEPDSGIEPVDHKSAGELNISGNKYPFTARYSEGAQGDPYFAFDFRYPDRFTKFLGSEKTHDIFSRNLAAELKRIFEKQVDKEIVNPVLFGGIEPFEDEDGQGKLIAGVTVVISRKDSRELIKNFGFAQSDIVEGFVQLVNDINLSLIAAEKQMFRR